MLLLLLLLAALVAPLEAQLARCGSPRRPRTSEANALVRVEALGELRALAAAECARHSVAPYKCSSTVRLLH